MLTLESIGTLTEVNFVMLVNGGRETEIKLVAPESFCEADATGPCIAASAELALPDSTEATSLVSTAEADVGRAVVLAPPIMSCEMAETICCIVSSESIVPGSVLLEEC